MKGSTTMMRIGLFLLAGLIALGKSIHAKADFYEFSTNTTAIQTISSFLFGFAPVTTTATGVQTFTLNTSTGAANIVSNYNGNDLPYYLCQHSVTTGNMTSNMDGSYKIVYTLLFSLQLTGGPLAGATFSTRQDANFQVNSTQIPFPAGTKF